ncbi:MAG TPA: septum site-determining protein MinC [Gammaproteobacteria bacterium]|nr:septum site-determining protein MinC [Gammaproteobacteria bacterium]
MNSLQDPAEKPPFELKGRMTSLPVMRLFSDDLAAIDARLRSQINRAPSLFRGAPLAIDVAALKSNALDLSALVALLRGQGIVPVAVRGGDETVRAAAAALNLGALEWVQEATAQVEGPTNGPSSSAGAQRKLRRAAPPPPPGIKTPTQLITQPVRSGQHIYARGGDLLILGTVSAGAEVIADGHIHVYGKLHGRALAGAQGDSAARIFAQSLEAELVAVAGVYRVSEEFDEHLRGTAVQAYLHGDDLVLEPL